MDRRILKPTRRNGDKYRSQRKQEPYRNDNFATSTPTSSRGHTVKRKCEDWDETPIKRSKCTENLQPYSANERLKKYRQALDQKKNQIVKVHKALENENENGNEFEKEEVKGTKQVDNKDRVTVKSPQKSAINDRIKKIRTNVKETNKIDNLCGNIVETKSFIDASVFTSDSLLNVGVDKNINDEVRNKNILHHCNNVDDMEDMDWSPINEKEVEADIKKLRESLPMIPNSKFLNLINDNENSISSISPTKNILYIIVDTNIFISHLTMLKSICKQAKLKYRPVIYIPWMVFQELDYFKDGRGGSTSIHSAAKRAVTFINDMLTQNDGFLKGETVHEALSHDFSNSNPDDNILFCCLKLQQNHSKIVLLSNDKNLRSKLLIHSVKACSTETIMSFLNKDYSDNNNQNLTKEKEMTKPEKVALVFTNACTDIIRKELEKAYGNTVYKMVNKPPWSLNECLNYIKRFWVPVFSLIITQKQCLKAVDDLLGYLLLHKNIGDLSAREQDEFIKLTLSLCVYFKNCLLPYEALMKTCILEIQKILQ